MTTGPQKILITGMSGGLRDDVSSFLLNNDSFPILENMYMWRKKLKKKTGTQQLGRLRRDLTAQALGTSPASPFSVNIKTALSLEADATLVPGTVVITIAAVNYTDAGNGTFPGGGTINYATGQITGLVHTGSGAVTGNFSYFPALPVMGLREFYDNEAINKAVNFPKEVAFDTKYAYTYNTGTKNYEDASFYKLLGVTGKPVTWTGTTVDLFQSINFKGAMWATNGVAGSHFKPITAISKATSAVLTISSPGLEVGDSIWINEVKGMKEINGLTGKVTGVAGNNVTVNINSSAFTAYTSGGVAQYLTKTLSGDGIRYYDGKASNRGWVNFCPPLSQFQEGINENIQYLKGAKYIIDFKNRLLFLGISTGTSNTSTSTFFKNRILHSGAITPYYSSLTPATAGTSDLAPTGFNPLAYEVGSSGAGDAFNISVDEKIVGANKLHNDLMISMESSVKKLVETGNNIAPFRVVTVNSQLGSEAPHASVNMDDMVLTPSDYGYVAITNNAVKRFDEAIPQKIFRIDNTNLNGNRTTALRDYQQELIYFTYKTNLGVKCEFPTETLVYNYVDKNFAIFKENFTAQGYHRRGGAGLTWSDLTAQGPYPTWADWTALWESSKTSAKYPLAIGGTPQGFVMIRDGVSNVNEFSRQITAFTGNTVTSPSHCLEVGQFVRISTFKGAEILQNSNADRILKVLSVTTTTFTVDATIIGTYVGGATFAVIDNIDVKTKFFVPFWSSGLGTRIGTQKYLARVTNNGEVTTDVFVSETTQSPVNDPTENSWINTSNVLRMFNKDIFGSTISGKLKWYRVAGSYIGEGVRIGFRYSDEQMKQLKIAQSELLIEAIEIDVYPSKVLA